MGNQLQKLRRPKSRCTPSAEAPEETEPLLREERHAKKWLAAAQRPVWDQHVGRVPATMMQERLPATAGPWEGQLVVTQVFFKKLLRAGHLPEGTPLYVATRSPEAAEALGSSTLFFDVDSAITEGCGRRAAYLHLLRASKSLCLSYYHLGTPEQLLRGPTVPPANLKVGYVYPRPMWYRGPRGGMFAHDIGAAVQMPLAIPKGSVVHVVAWGLDYAQFRPSGLSLQRVVQPLHHFHGQVQGAGEEGQPGAGMG